MIKRLRYLLLYLLLIPSITQAGIKIELVGGLEKLEGINLGQEQDPVTVASRIINSLLLLLGIISVIITLLGGYKWMTSAGNVEKVTEAKNLIKNGIIGLIIILSAYTITRFVIENMVNVTEGTGPTGNGNG